MELLHTLSNDQKTGAVSAVLVGITIFGRRCRPDLHRSPGFSWGLSIGDVMLFIGAAVQFNEGINEMFAAFAIGARETRHLGNVHSFKQQKFHGKWGNRSSCSKAKRIYM